MEHSSNSSNLYEFFCFVFRFVLESQLPCPPCLSFLFYNETLELQGKKKQAKNNLGNKNTSNLKMSICTKLKKALKQWHEEPSWKWVHPSISTTPCPLQSALAGREACEGGGEGQLPQHSCRQTPSFFFFSPPHHFQESFISCSGGVVKDRKEYDTVPLRFEKVNCYVWGNKKTES